MGCRYNIVAITPPVGRTERALMSTFYCEDPRDAQKIYNEQTELGRRVTVSNNYLGMDETFIFERKIWEV